MISKEEFLDKVRIEVFPLLEKLEKERKTTLFYSSLLFLLSFFLFRLAFRGSPSFPIFLFAFFFAIAGYFYSFRFFNVQKRQFTKLFFSFLSEDFVTHSKFISQGVLNKSLLFPYFNQLKKKDSFSGVFSNTKFSVLECVLYDKIEKFRLKKFHGLILSFPINKKFKKRTLLLSRSFFCLRLKLKRIVLESNKVNKKYKIYSESQQEARYLLSPAFLEKLMSFQKMLGCSRVDISFFDGKILLAFHTRKNLFESYHLFRNALNIRLYERFYDEVDSIRKIIKLLNIENKHLDKNYQLRSTTDIKINK